jgi:hypothetical protein
MTSKTHNMQLGFALGLVPSALRNRRLALARQWVADGWRSALALAFVSGLYR